MDKNCPTYWDCHSTDVIVCSCTSTYTTRKATNGRMFSFQIWGGNMLISIDARPHMEVEKVLEDNFKKEVEHFMGIWNDANPT